MRCINMKITGVLLFLINLMIIKCNVTLPKDKTSQSLDNGNLNKFEKDCPDFWKVIQSNNLTEWTNCEDQSETSKIVTEEKVLQFACFLAKNMMVFICDNKLNVTNQYLRIPLKEKESLCPFQFPQLFELGRSHLAKELTSEKNCPRICYDLYEPRNQCIILRKFNNYLRSYEEQLSRLGLVLPDIRKSPDISTPNLKTASEDNKLSEQKTSKETTTKSKVELTNAKDATNPVISQAVETKKPDLQSPDLEIPEPKNIASENPDYKKFDPESKNPIHLSPKIDEKLEVSKNEFESFKEENREQKNYDDEVSNLDDTFGNDNSMDSPTSPSKYEVNDPAEAQKNTLDNENGKVQMPFNQQEISLNNGFLQAEDSHFFFYFIVVSSIIVIGYIGFHNKNKILAYALEGTSGRRNRRRPNPARYRKLETNLEEAISSNASETIASSVVY